MPPYAGFAGGSYVPRARFAAGNRLVNLYLEKNEDVAARSPLVMQSCPGLGLLFTTLDDGPVRTLFYQDGLGFALAGQHAYQLKADGTWGNLGPVAFDGYPGAIATNGQFGHQVLFVTGGHGYIYDTIAQTFAEIADPNFPTGFAVACAYTDGYFVVLNTNSAEFQLSALEDGTTWSALDENQRSSSSDNLQMIIVDHDELILFGTKTTQTWTDTGDANTPFQPLEGAFMEQGLTARWAAAKFDNTLIGVSLDLSGAGWVWRADGYKPVRISHHGVELWIATAGALEQLVGWTYSEQGHSFYCLYHPNAPSTQVYDAENNQWHERDFYNVATGLFEPARGMSHCLAWNNMHLVGDRLNGNIYVQSLASFTDMGGARIRKRRRWRGIAAGRKLVFFDRLRINMDLGGSIVGSAPPAAVNVIYRNSDDGGNTWNPDRQGTTGVPGAYDTTVEFTQNGAARDRVEEIEVSDPAFVAFIDADVDVRIGNH